MNRVASLSSILRLFITLFIVLTLHPPAGAGEVWLVQCTVVDSKVEGKENLSTHRIDHVYLGPPAKKGILFYHHYSLVTREDLHGRSILGPAPKVGEKGIWALRELNEEVRSETVYGWDHRFPKRKGVDDEYEVYVGLAEAVEKYKSAADNDRLDILKESAHTTNAAVAYWSVREIGRSKLKFSAATLDEMIYDKKLPFAAQAALDAELCEVQQDFWRHSEHRLRMVKGWLTATLNPLEKSRIDQRLGHIAARPETDGFAPAEREAMGEAIRKRLTKE